MEDPIVSSRFRTLCSLFLVLSGGLLAAPSPSTAQCQRTLRADVIAFDQVFYWNRMGAFHPQGMMYALSHDVFPTSVDPNDEKISNSCAGGACSAGGVRLRSDKRPRPLVLRMNVGDCLQIHFRNLLDPVRRDNQQVATRDASFHAIGMQVVESIRDDGSNVGENGNAGNGVVPTGGSAEYVLYAEREGQHAVYSTGASTTGEGDGGQMNAGLFGAIVVEPRGSKWYRSQITGKEMERISSGDPRIIDYDATFPLNHSRAGLPVLEMLLGNRIVHSDLTAIIGGEFLDGYPDNPVYPKREQPFREFVIIYHDEIGARQAFEKIFDDRELHHTLHSVRDAFAINYGTGGIGAEILANRLGVGPMLDCPECKYEEFFLSAWTVGDPAMVVDLPADQSNPKEGKRATQAFYPDDPSNVYHSYLMDHLKFRILHGGSKEHHVHHQHTHQWLYAPDSDESAYLDSQAIGPGASFTLEMVHNGSGNRNQAVGDSIFHCHFYPHFAQGMWAMWRVHDVFENGFRRLPDGEILAGTPTPGVVPLPGLAMAPMPGAQVTIAPDPLLPTLGGQVKINGKFVRELADGDVDGNPGYPYWVPGIAGRRPPHPPLDTIDDGGLARHVVLKGESIHVETRLDFTKEIEEMLALELDEQGEPIEKVAMKFHEQRRHESTTPEGSPAFFTTNGSSRAPGAPFADPCIDDAGNPVGGPINEKGYADPARTYKAADIQLDVIFNKAGWHFPQQRILTLWNDVEKTFSGERAPEPLFFRANSRECLEYQLTNLVPNIYELDDFQVRTPTDILGQHIHLVKFDVLASDGAANGFNYEDGSFSPDEVAERAHALRAYNNCIGDEVNGGDPRDGTIECPVLEAHPFFGAGPGGRFLGAQTTVQRWYADEVLNLTGDDRTLRTVFTHDHFGPSTHQQTGLYAGLVIEPDGSTWRDPDSGAIFGNRDDGGPTSWRADILTENDRDSYREFLVEFADFQLAYEAGSHPDLPSGRGPTFQLPWHGVARQPGEGYDVPEKAINPPGKKEVGLPFLLAKPDDCPVLEDDETGPADVGPPVPCPEAVSADDPGTMVANYRNEPVALRVYDPSNQRQAPGNAGDLSLAFSTRPTRADPDLNIQPGFYPPLTPNLHPRDPYTPMMQAFEHDKVQIRVLVGAHEEGHNFSVNGMKWLFEPSWGDSGYRNSQMMGISEHFELEIPQLVKNPLLSTQDYLWAAGSATDDLWNGLWGLFRVFRGSSAEILKLPNNPAGGKPTAPGEEANFDGVCPRNAPVRSFEVVAVAASTALPGGELVYNSRTGPNGHGPLTDPTAILYVRASDLDNNDRLRPGVPIEPLILRANAGDCIELELRNGLSDLAEVNDRWGFNTLPMLIEDFNNNQIRPSMKVGLHSQLVFTDVSRYDGNNVGLNQIRTANVGQTVKYQWYAGDIFINDAGIVEATPIEFGATNLIPADRIKHPSKGAIGALIIEPKGAVWVEDSDLATCGAPGLARCSRAGATVSPGDFSEFFEPFREFVVIFQDDVNMRCDGCGSDPLDTDAVPNLAESDDPEDSGQKALNYRTEPMWFRYGYDPDADLGFTGDLVITNILTNAQVGGDPVTPVFQARPGAPVRMRVLDPGGHARNHVFQVHGHVWQQEPYTANSTRIGDNPLSLWEGAKMGHGPTNHFDAVLEGGAGGAFAVEGDYLFRDHSSFLFDGGLWGILRVKE